MSRTRQNNNEKNSEKLSRLIKYLQHLATLKTKIIRNVEEYPYIIWLYEIDELKHKKCCSSKFLSNEDPESDLLLEIRYVKKTPIPEQLKRFINYNLEGEIIKVEDIPNELTNLFKHFNEEWQTWNKIYRIYSKLYSIYQEELKSGEEYELLMSFGLLSWQTARANVQLKRHIISLRATLEFDAKGQKFIIHEDPQGRIKIETEFIPTEDIPQGIEKLKEEIHSVIENQGFLSKEFKDELKKFAHFLSTEGKFIDILKPNLRDYPKAPILEFAPAFIYRKRSVGPFYDFLSNLLEQANRKDGSSILKILAEIEAQPYPEESDSQTIQEEFDKVLFPKPYNDEQIRIVDRIEKSNVVLVQGPPGTGKSHTIANLIYHLLAYGKRVLITSKSSRALKVLKSLIPNEISTICISLLGDAQEERKDLEASVQGILAKLNLWEEINVNNELERFEKELKNLKEKESKLVKSLLDHLNEEKTEFRVSERYRGNPAKIAQIFNEDTEKYSWFKDRVKKEEAYPFPDINWERTLDEIRYFDKEKRKKLSLEIPNPYELINPKDLEELFKKETELKEQIEKISNNLHNYLKDIILIDQGNLNEIHEMFSNYLQNLSILKQYLQFNRSIELVANKYLRSYEYLYENSIEETINLTKDIKNKIKDLIDINFENRRIEKSINAIYEDTKKLINHFSTGGGEGWFIFRPKIIRQNRYIFKDIYINGRSCSKEELNLLFDFLDVEIKIRKIIENWGNDLLEYHKFSLRKKYDFVSEISIILNYLKGLKLQKNKLIEILAIKEPQNIDFFDEEEIRKIIQTIFYQQLNKELDIIRKNINSAYSKIEKFKSLPEINIFFESIEKRDMGLYNEKFDKISKLHEDKKRLKDLDEKIKEIKNKLPTIIKEIHRSPNDSDWLNKLEVLDRAWDWARAKAWLEDFTSHNIQSLNEELNKIEKDKRECIRKIVELRAWRFMKNRINEEHSRHMICWQQQIKRIGKGTGKYAYKHRKEAQRHLNEIKHVIPAWIMPLHRVWDTIKCESEVFDFLIVDEASQIGFEGIPLFYIAKKVVIVGDDKQISPEAVGIDRSEVFKLIEEFLYDFKFRDSFYIESSIFDHAELRFSKTKVSLREHFRCMPEIIRFCNDLCYSTAPLIPLRQYPPERLNPLERVFVEGAYCEGDGQNIRNEQEAKFLSQKIVKLCQDPRYKDKSMGVIVLQGQAQAKLIERLLFDSLSSDEIHKRRIICGNPYSFQGDERDIIFLSMVIAPDRNRRIGVLSDDHDKRRFNVAVSRAKDQIWLFHSVKIEDLSPYCFRRKLLEYFYDCKTIKIAGIELEELERIVFNSRREIDKPPKPFDSWFEVDVALELLREKYFVIPQYKISEYRIDLVIEGGAHRLAVECDGDKHHSGEQIEHDLYRQRILERCGWKFFRIRASDFYFNKNKVVKDLKRTLEINNIYPLKKEKINYSKEDKKESFDKNYIIEIGDRIKYIDISKPQLEIEIQIIRESSKPEIGVINYQTPLAQALLGAKINDYVEVNLPTGIKTLKILEIIKSSIK